MIKDAKTLKYISAVLLLAVIFAIFPTQINTVNAAMLQLSDIKSESVVLMDGDTGQVLFEKNMHAKMYPASITKIMTALLALEKGSPADIITMSHDAVYSVGRDTSHISLEENEQLTLEQALYAAAIVSANDACNGIAELIGGSMDNFAKLMTARAKELGALNTNFNNPHGLPDTAHYTSAYDMALIMSAAVKIPAFTKAFSMMTYEMPPTNIQTETRYFHRINSFIKEEPHKYDDIIAEKTGWTSDAGFTYVAAAKRGGRTLVAVVMKSITQTDRWEDVSALFDYGFDEFIPVSYSAAEFTKDNYNVEFADGAKANMKLIPSGDFNCLVLKSFSKEDIEIKYTLSVDSLTGKIDGKAVFSLKSQSGTYSGLGEADLRVYFNGGVNIDDSNIPLNSGMAVSAQQQTEPKKKITALSVFLTIISVILQISGAATVLYLILYLRKHIIIQKRKRNKYNYNRRMYR